MTQNNSKKPEPPKFPDFKSFNAIFVKFLIDFVNLNPENVQHNKARIRCPVYEEINDTKIDTKSEIFRISLF